MFDRKLNSPVGSVVAVVLVHASVLALGSACSSGIPVAAPWSPSIPMPVAKHSPEAGTPPAPAPAPSSRGQIVGPMVVIEGETTEEAPSENEPPSTPEADAATPIETLPPLAPPPIAYDGWKGFQIANCSYMAPKKDFIGADGGVDVVFHFHAGQMTERDVRASGFPGVFVACGFGIGGGGYVAAFSDPNRFGVVVSRLMATIGHGAKRKDVHLRKLGLASWSAGFAAITKILSVPKWYAATDAVLLFDSIHAPYTRTAPGGQPKGAAHAVDVRSMGLFVRFARDAAQGKKTMVVTHSSIVPPDYASSTEATTALLETIGVESVVPDETVPPDARGMTLTRLAEEGDLHVRGFLGLGPRDHFDQLHLVGEAFKTWIIPRWQDASLKVVAPATPAPGPGDAHVPAPARSPAPAKREKEARPQEL